MLSVLGNHHLVTFVIVIVIAVASHVCMYRPDHHRRKGSSRTRDKSVVGMSVCTQMKKLTGINAVVQLVHLGICRVGTCCIDTCCVGVKLERAAM